MTVDLDPRRRVERLLFDRHAPLPFAPAEWLLGLLRYPYALIRDLLTGELNLRAMGLVYTTLLSLVPLGAFAFAVLKGLGVHRDLEPLLYEFLCVFRACRPVISLQAGPAFRRMPGHWG